MPPPPTTSNPGDAPSRHNPLKIFGVVLLALVILGVRESILIARSLSTSYGRSEPAPVTLVTDPHCFDVLPDSAFERIVAIKDAAYTLDESYSVVDGEHLLTCVDDRGGRDFEKFIYYVSWRDDTTAEAKFYEDKDKALYELEAERGKLDRSGNAFTEEMYSNIGASAYWYGHQLRVLSSNKKYYVLVSNYERLNVAGMESAYEEIYTNVAREIDANLP